MTYDFPQTMTPVAKLIAVLHGKVGALPDTIAYLVADVIQEEFPAYWMETLWTGSTRIRGQGQDIDILLAPAIPDEELGDTDMKLMVDVFKRLGFEVHDCEYHSQEEGYSLVSLRFENVNIILVSRGLQHWKKALEVCRALAAQGVILDRRARAAVHAVIVDNMSAEKAYDHTAKKDGD